MFSILPQPFGRNFQMKVCIQKCRREKHVNIYSPLHTNLTHACKGDCFLPTRSPSSTQRKCYFLVVLSVQTPRLICLGGRWWRVTWQNVSLLLLIFKVAAWLTLIPSQRVSCKSFPPGKLWNSLCVCVCGGGCWVWQSISRHPICTSIQSLISYWTWGTHLDWNQTQFSTSVLTSFGWHLDRYVFGQSRDKSGDENGNPLQYSCLENPMDRGALRKGQMAQTCGRY